MTTLHEDEYLTISGIQHFAFCRRQWALLFLEDQWAENLRTVEGHLFHERAHDAGFSELRGDLLITRGMRVVSKRLCVTGVCDVVEFRKSATGITLCGREGKWKPYPVEYKKGMPNEFGSDELQLCAQAMCLEEMLVCIIDEGSLFYGEPKRRTRVALTAELRGRVEAVLTEMAQYQIKGHTPKAKRTKSCNACSLKELCLPALSKTQSVRKFMEDCAKDGAP